MSRSARKVWTWFVACVGLLLLGLSVLSVQAWQLDGDRTEAQHRALYEEQIRLALWRLDSALAPLLVRESGRTHGQFVAPPGEALPAEVRLRFARNHSGTSVVDPRATADARKQFETHVDANWLDAQVPRPKAPGGLASAQPVLSQAQRQGAAQLSAPGVQAAGAAADQGRGEGIRDGNAGGLSQLTNGQASPTQAKQTKGSNLVLPEQQTIAYQNTVSDNEFQRRVLNVQKNSPGYGGSAKYRQDANWEWNGARTPEPALGPLVKADVQSETPVELDGVAVPDELGKLGKLGKLGSKKLPETDDTLSLRGVGVGSGSGSGSGSSSAVATDKLSHEPLFVRESVMAALWRGDMLLLARRAEAEDGHWIEGTWLDWPTLEASLRHEIEDLLPGAALEPVLDSPQDTSRLLATIPVRLLPGPLPAVASAPWTAMRFAIAGAWLVALIVGIAAWFLLRATLELSQRRGAFVSAVTHELRTPLTTFRMYTEMLSDGMVTDAAQKAQYIETLRSEAQRLDNLVQNVLAYARIEDRSAATQVEDTCVGDLLASITPRLSDRCSEADCEFLVIGVSTLHDEAIRVDRTAVEQILFNLVDNAAKYGLADAAPRIELRAELNGAQLQLRVVDNGAGIPKEERARVFRPFEKAEAHAAGTKPGVGLGLALCRQLANQLGGELRFVQPPGPGACFELNLPLRGA